MGFMKTMKAMAVLATSLFFSANALFAVEQNQGSEMSDGMNQKSTTLRSATSYPEGSPVFHNGKLSVKGTQMVNECGKAIQLRGMSSHGLAWTPAAYTEESLKALVEQWNVDLFRIAIYTHEWGGYCIRGDRQWKTVDDYNTYLDGLIDICGKLGIYCLIDWHVLNEGSGNPNTTLDYAIPFWKYMSEKHKDDIHVMYEICNEPNGNSVTWNVVKEYAEKVIPVIRENDPEKIIICGSPTWSQDVDQAAKNPLNYDNLMYTLHFYAGTHGQYLIDKAETAMKEGLAIFVTEFGTSKADGNGGVFATECDVWMNWMEKNKISWANWSFVDKNETSAALVSGAVNKKEWTNLSESGKYVMNWLWKPKGYDSCNGEVDDREYEPVVYPLAAVASSDGSAFYHNGALHVADAFVENECDNKAQLKGLSAGDATTGQSCLSLKAPMKTIADSWKASILRIPVTADGKGSYGATGSDQVMSQDDYNAYLDKLVGNATKYGLYCVLDWQLGEGNPMANLKAAKSFWKFASKRYVNFDNVIFEICSNPTVSWSKVKQYADTIIPLIRENDPDKMIICGTAKSNHDVESVVASPLNYKNISYGVQIYAGADGQTLKNQITNAVSKGISLTVTDLSLLSSADGNTLNTNEANDWIAFLNDNRITWINGKFAGDGSATALLAEGACSSNGWTNATTAGEYLMGKLAEPKGFQSCKEDGLEKVSFDEMVYFYPNPVTDELTITVPADKQASEVQIFDMTGRFVLSSSELTMNLSALVPGVYYVKVVFPEGVSVKRIVKN